MRNKNNSNNIVVVTVVLILVSILVEVICGGEFGSERMAVTTGKRVK